MRPLDTAFSRRRVRADTVDIEFVQRAPSDAGRHAKKPLDGRLVGPLGLEPRTKGFTLSPRFRWERTISSPSWGAGRSCLSLSATAALR